MTDPVRCITAYEIQDPTDMPITRGSIHREWMKASRDSVAYHCLPLGIANQNGWVIANPATVIARWNGGPATSDLVIGGETGLPGMGTAIAVGAGVPSMAEAYLHTWIKSHFGNGILTFLIPYLFRTPPGINLWIKGPSNWIKDGLFPLEGVVEADWTPATFTMNWQLTRPGLPVRFKKGEPICQIVPIPRGLAESLQPRQVPLRNNPEVEAAYYAFEKERNAFNQALAQRQPEAYARGWQKDYFLGRVPSTEGTPFAGHQTHIALKEFVREPG